MPEFTLPELLYAFALLVTAGSFWSVLKVRPEMRSAFWFGLAFLSGALAFGVEFLRFLIPIHIQALFGAGFYSAMAACFVVGLILRADKAPPRLLIGSIAGVSTLAVWLFALVDIHVLVRVCIAQFSSGLLLLVALVYARERRETTTDKAIITINMLTAVALFIQPVIVWLMVGLPQTSSQYDTSAMFITMGVFTTLSSISSAVLLVREYIMLIIDELRHVANRDKLTGLYNRRGFDGLIGGFIHEAEQAGTSVALIAFDIDHFKQINDTYGHGFGDDVLHTLGTMLRADQEQSGFAVRLGGEEFLLVMHLGSLCDAESRAGVIRERIEKHRFYIDGLGVKCTASFGVALYRHDETVLGALARADEALYGAKASGRNCVKTEIDLQVAKLHMASAQMVRANEGDLDIADHAKAVPRKNR